MKTEIPNKGNRLVSMLLDHFLTCIILMIPILPLMFSQQDKMRAGEPLSPWYQFVFLALMFVYFLKDSFNGRSLAKRMTKLQVIDNRTNKVASPVKCFVRNLPIVIWPVEVLITLFSPQRRLGDFLAGTRMVNYGFPKADKFDFESEPVS
jgi:uncharacterized RDD family membrane protein YckC